MSSEEELMKMWLDYYDNVGMDKEGIPRRPDVMYANEGWISWADWLGVDE